MGRIVVTESVTLDGVMQAPGTPDEDTRGGFAHGGWGREFSDAGIVEFLGVGTAPTTPGAMLFGRRSYEELLRAWTAATEPNPFTEHLTRASKYVATRDAGFEPAYPSTTVLVGEASSTVADLSASLDGDLSVIGSGVLVRALHAAGLVDRCTLLIHPITLGSGTRLFGDDIRRDLRLERSMVAANGVIVAEYAVMPAVRDDGGRARG